MSRGATHSRAAERSVGAFEVEIETFWCERLQQRGPMAPRTVYLTSDWALCLTPRSTNVEVGTYTQAVTLQAFREDCFFALEGS